MTFRTYLRSSHLPTSEISAVRWAVQMAVVASLAAGLSTEPAAAQADDPPLSIFGFFQPQYAHDIESDGDPSTGSFTLQQLNVFMQKDLSRRWSSLVNLEFVNSFSSSRRTGSFGVEEAWARYRSSSRFNLKLGLHIPRFNYLNDIKNRLPLLPYVIRPLAYETAFAEIVPLEQFAPTQAFVSAYGFVSAEHTNVDYSVFLGNSPNIQINDGNGISGVDTTSTFLVGGRLGLRRENFEIGVSSTLDFLDLGVVGPSLEPELSPRVRLGADVAYRRQSFYFESEITNVQYSNLPAGVELEAEFYHALVGYDFSESWGGYGMLNYLDLFGLEVYAWSPGAVYRANDKLSLKGQYHLFRARLNEPGVPDIRSHQLSAAVSVFF